MCREGLINRAAAQGRWPASHSPNENPARRVMPRAGSREPSWWIRTNGLLNEGSTLGNTVGPLEVPHGTSGTTTLHGQPCGFAAEPCVDELIVSLIKARYASYPESCTERGRTGGRLQSCL